MGRVAIAALAGVLLTSGIVYAMSMKTTVYISWYTGSVVAVRHGILQRCAGSTRTVRSRQRGTSWSMSDER